MYQIVQTYLCPGCGSSNIEMVDEEVQGMACECGLDFDLEDADVKETVTESGIDSEEGGDDGERS